MKDWTGGWTRRQFLERVGLAGGAAAVYETMTALGLINLPHAWAGPPRLPREVGAGKTVLILGAGIGGLTAAYELTRAGYRCEILEAQNRAGGRSLTARQGTVIHEQSREHGATRQLCQFDPGLYLNMGPGRLPYHHRRVLHYCRELGVPLEVYVMETTANLFQTDQAWNGQAMVNRRIANDTRGYIAELLAKAVRKSALDDELDEGDRDRLLCLLKVFGDLGQGDACTDCSQPAGSCPDPAQPASACVDCGKTCQRCIECGETCPACLAYQGSTRSGCDAPLTVLDACSPEAPLAFSELLRSEFWRHRFYQPIDYEWQATLFQPVGGMDQIVEGFKRQVGSLIEYESPVEQIQLADDGVVVTYRDGFTGNVLQKRADFCLSNIPLPVLQGIPANFEPEFGWAVQHGEFAPTCKVGWQANARFWEDDRYQIYGGISWIDDLITQMWYPSNDYFGGKGTLTGAYNYEDNARAMGRMSLAQRLVAARKGAVKLHPEFGDDKLVPQALGLSIAWQNVPYQQGGWAEWTDCEEDRRAYARLLAPDRRFHVVGDQVSTLPGWQEGAMMSAEHVVEQLAGIRPRDVPRILEAPNTRRLVQGRF
jgi:monoamine oxidase